jgi:hypothetical protein
VNKPILTLGTIPEDVKQKAGKAILGYSTPILGLKSFDRTEEPVLLGSATLVQYGKHKGLLTAQHVIEKTDYYKCVSVGLVISFSEHRFTIKREYLQEKAIKPDSPELGPDLAFIKIPEVDASRIAARKGFWQMDTNLKRLPGLLVTRNRGMWIIFGCPASYQGIEPSASSFERTFVPGGLMAMSSKPRVIARKTYDYFEVSAFYEGGNDLPETFAGVSGGGLWYVPLSNISAESEEIQVHHPTLMGLAFYETGVNERSRVIRCHGPKSIYLKMQSVLET